MASRGDNARAGLPRLEDGTHPPVSFLHKPLRTWLLVARHWPLFEADLRCKGLDVYLEFLSYFELLLWLSTRVEYIEK